ncbi:CopG family transcriptional regulator [uncultured Mameliella sp.]|uniref:CopG family ribbon-helix-helix protein n=1 Tax=uncultured Mameliella sp. TaxID=1447087 RepID=UPI002626ACB1|nr:CopG family transcriptional regulator [uncultured Mameliella sp.]
MGERATITIHTTPETRARLEKLASATRRSKSFLGNEAIERYLAAEEEFVAGVQQGLAEAEAGKGMSTEELKADLHTAIDRVAASRS